VIDPQRNLEQIWDSLLSRETDRIIKTFLSLDEQNQVVVKDHLVRMINEPGWHPEQVSSAMVALKALSGAGSKE
jgi:hypothetical protein